MKVFEAVCKVLAVRKYQDKPVPQAIIRRIVEEGRLTGSSMNQQPWHFIKVESRDTLRRPGNLVRTGPYIEQAPWPFLLLATQPKPLAKGKNRASRSPRRATVRGSVSRSSDTGRLISLDNFDWLYCREDHPRRTMPIQGPVKESFVPNDVARFGVPGFSKLCL